MAFQTKDTFTFDHTTQADYPNWIPSVTKANMNARGEELRLALNAVVNLLNATAAGASGANFIGFDNTGMTKLTGTTVQQALAQAETELKAFIGVNANAEVGSAHVSAVKAKTFADLDGRLEESEQDLVSYKAETAKHNIFVTPEDFGAKGDGLADDTIALQNAINDCIANKRQLSSSRDKIYAVSSAINILDYIDIKFNGATIKALTAVTSILCINHTNLYGIVEGVTLDCNNLAEIGLYIIMGKKKSIRDLIIINGSKTLFRIDAGNEIITGNWHLYGSSNTCIGMDIRTADCHYTDIIMIDCHTAIKTSMSSFYTRVHGWINTQAFLANSKFMEINGGAQFLTSCYPDTYFYNFYLTASVGLYLTNCCVYYNPLIYTLAYMGDVAPYLFYYTGAYSWETVARNCSFTGLSAFTDKCKFTNISNFMGNVDMSNKYSNIKDFLTGNKALITPNVTNVLSSPLNLLQRVNGVISLSYVIQVNTDATPAQTIDTPIGAIPFGFHPALGGIFAVADYSTTQWGSTLGTLHVYIPDNGAMTTKIPDSITGIIYIRFSCTYISNDT